MSSSPAPVTWQKIASIVWFPIFLAIVLPITFEVAFHEPTPHNVPIATVGSAGQVAVMQAQLHRINATGFVIRPFTSIATAKAAVRTRDVAAAYVAGGPTGATLYLARAASSIRASYLQAGFARVAAETRTQPPPIVDLVPLARGDSGTGIFFFTFPLMMVGLLTAIVLLQLPWWGVGRRVAFVAGVGVIGSLTAYFTAVGVHMLPARPLLILYAFVLTQVYGQLMVGAAILLKQYFLPVSLTFALILAVPASGGTVTPDLLPGFFRFLSHVLPLAQGVKIARGVAYFHNAGIAQAQVVMAAWAVVALATLGAVWLRQAGSRIGNVEAPGVTTSPPAPGRPDPAAAQT